MEVLTEREVRPGVVELITFLLAAVVTLLAAALTAIAWSAARRFEDTRFFLIGIAFLTLSAVGLLSILSENFGLFDEAFAVEPAPLVLVLVALAVLYLALFQPHRGAGARPDG